VIIGIIFLMLNAFWILALVFCVEALFLNITEMGKRFPRIPGDIYLDRIGIYIKIPFVSVIVLTIILTFFFNFFQPK
jgi:hypothetical protein